MNDAVTENSGSSRTAHTYTAGDAPARVSGYIVDSAIVLLGSFVLLSALGLVHGPAVEVSGSGGLSDRVDVDRTRFAIDTAMVAFASGAYFVGSWVRRGATIGQRTVGLRVLGTNEQHGLTITAAVIRFVALGAPLWVTAGLLSGNARVAVWCLALLWYGVLFVSVVRGTSTTGLHDRIARTIVVREVALVELGTERIQTVAAAE